MPCYPEYNVYIDVSGVGREYDGNNLRRWLSKAKEFADILRETGDTDDTGYFYKYITLS